MQHTIYTVLQSTTRNALIAAVESYLKLGWQVQGGIAVIGVTAQEREYFQSMTKSAGNLS